MSEEQNIVADTQKEMCATYQATVDFFNKLPNCITECKKQYILDQARFNVRFIFLCLGTLSVAAATARCIKLKLKKILLVTPSIIKVTRNSVISYVGAGLFLVPETFNPFLEAKK